MGHGLDMRIKVIIGLGILLAVLAILLFERDFPAAQVDAKYSNAASQFLTLADGSKIHYRDQGTPGSLPLVLIHGSNSSLHTWEPWVKLLGSRYRIITLDLPGHGLTGQTLADDYSSAAYVATVHAVATHLGLPPFVLGGNSMGGGVTWRFTLEHPDSVLGLVLVDASGLPAWRELEDAEANPEDKPSTPWAFSLLRKPWFQGLARYIDPHWLVEQGLKASHVDPALVDEALVARYYDLSMRAGTRDATLKRFSTLGQRSTNELDLSAITQPALILWGAQDSVIPSSVGTRFSEALSNAQLIVYPNIGHIPMEELPERSAADVDEFIQRKLNNPAGD